MSDVTIEDQGLLVIVEDGASEEEWQDGRSEGVTASRAHDVANGSRKTWRRILDEQLNGSTFTGNKDTRRGNEREPELIAAAAQLDGVVILAPSNALFGRHENPLHRATPDGLGIHERLGHFGAEVKSHGPNWARDDIPAEHMDQMQWGMHVLDVDWWLYVWEVEGVDGIRHEWVPRNDKRITQLAAQADAFIAWREAGAPEIDDIPDDVDDALADYAEGLDLAARGEKLKKAARKVIDPWAADQKEPGEGSPLRKQGSRAGVFFEPRPALIVLDEEAWEAAEPDSYAQWVDLKSRLAETAEHAKSLYSREKPQAATFRVTPNGGTA